MYDGFNITVSLQMEISHAVSDKGTVWLREIDWLIYSPCFA